MQQFLIEKNEQQNNLQNNNQQRNPDEQQAFQRNKQPLLPYFEQHMPFELRGFNLDYDMRLWRNRCIIALFIQIISSIAGFSFYFMRKARYVLIVNTLSLIFVSIGFSGVLQFEKFRIAIHGIVTSSVLGAVFLYSLLDVLFSSPNPDSTASENHLIILFTLPYLVDLCSGLTTFYLTYLIMREEEIRQEEAQLEDLPVPVQGNQDNLCVVCLYNQRNTVFYKCGHKAVCSNCSQGLLNRYNPVCPICRQKIEDVIKQYDL